MDNKKIIYNMGKDRIKQLAEGFRNYADIFEIGIRKDQGDGTLYACFNLQNHLIELSVEAQRVLIEGKSKETITEVVAELERRTGVDFEI